MQYELRNMKFGHKLIASENAKNNLLSTCKKWHGSPVWAVHRIIEEPVLKVESVEDEAQAEVIDELEDLKAEYEAVVGKKPHHKLSADRMKLEIENAR